MPPAQAQAGRNARLELPKALIGRDQHKFLSITKQNTTKICRKRNQISTSTAIINTILLTTIQNAYVKGSEGRKCGSASFPLSLLLLLYY